jgi:hypothetical protein
MRSRYLECIVAPAAVAAPGVAIDDAFTATLPRRSLVTCNIRS